MNTYEGFTNQQTFELWFQIVNTPATLLYIQNNKFITYASLRRYCLQMFPAYTSYFNSQVNWKELNLHLLEKYNEAQQYK